MQWRVGVARQNLPKIGMGISDGDILSTMLTAADEEVKQSLTELRIESWARRSAAQIN